MRRVLFPLLILASLQVFSQSAADFAGRWVKTKMTYKDGTPLPDEYIETHAYQRFDFDGKGTLAIAFSPSAVGTDLRYNSNGSQLKLMLKTSGSVLNAFRIDKIDNDEIILLEQGKNAFNGDDCIRYHFTREEKLNRQYQPTADDIVRINSTDTLFQNSTYIYARLKNGRNMRDELLDGAEQHSGTKDSFFKATFIVNANGLADSLTIINSISPKFDAVVTRNFNNLKSKWIPAAYGGKPVSVKMLIQVPFYSSTTFFSVRNYNTEAIEDIEKKDYETALLYLNKALEKDPYNKESLFFRALTYHYQDKKTEACEDLKRLRSLGSLSGSGIEKKICSQ